MGELRCKGLMLKNRAALLGEQCDAETELHPRLSAELRDGLAYGRIVSGGWYPIAWLRELHRAGTEATGRGEDLACRNPIACGNLSNVSHTPPVQHCAQLVLSYLV